MKISHMRFLDRSVGSVMSAVLTAMRRITDLFIAEPSGRPQRILFVKLVEQGATVVAEPALRRAIGMVGRDNVFVAVFTENRFILDILDLIPSDNVIPIRSDGLGVVFIDTLRAIRRMRAERIDTAIDFEFFSRYSGALTYLSGAKRRVGLHSFAGEAGYRGDLMTHRVAYNFVLHAGETYQSLVEALTQSAAQLPAMDFTLPMAAPQTRFAAGKKETAEAEKLLARLVGSNAKPPLILLNANSGDILPLRRWPAERYVELARRLLERYPEVVVGFTGSPEERVDAEAAAASVGSDRCVSLGGRTTLRQLLIVYSLAEVLVTNDSGPAHYATLTPIDVVTLFGLETPAVFGSRSPRSHILWAGLPCSPCVNAFNQRVTTCTNNVCMQQISVAEVYATVCKVFDARESGGHAAIGSEKSAAAIA